MRTLFVRGRGGRRRAAGAHCVNACGVRMNVRRWREADGTSCLIRFIEAQHDHRWAHDQDALNAVFCGEFLELAPRWNFQPSMLWSEPDGLGLSYWEFRRLLAATAIVHYTSPSKPWHFSNTPPSTRTSYTYLSKTPYHSFAPQAISLRSEERRVGIEC